MTATTEATPEAPSLPDMLQQAMIQKAIVDALSEAQDAHREATKGPLFAANKNLGVKSLDISLDGEKYAKATVTEPSDRHVVTDNEAFIEWVQENYPTEVKVEVTVNETWKKNFLKSLIVGDDGELVDKDTGTIVDGTKNIPAGDPTSFSITWNKKGESAVAVLRAALPPEALAAFGIEPVIGELGGDA